MNPRKYPDKEDEVCAAYLAGERNVDIARRFDIPSGTVNTIVRRAGIRRSRADNLRQRIIKAYDGDCSISAIAERVGCSPRYVYLVARECGLRSEAA